MTLQARRRHFLPDTDADTTTCGRTPGPDDTTRITKTNCGACLRTAGAQSRKANTPRARVKPRRATPRRRTAPQEDATWWETATLALLRRCGGRCERCGRDLGDNLERHHRQRRQVGGDRLANLALLHTRCHQWVTEHPEEATALGLIVSSYATDPASVPLTKGGVPWMLDDTGGQTRA